jgi:hypothetical protein
MTPEQGHTAKRTRAQEREARAEQALALQRMGTRAVVAEVLVQKAEKVARTVEHLLNAGAAGDLAAAKALVPWIDQAYGKPTERVEFKQPSTWEELETLSEEDLERLVAQVVRTGCAASARKPASSTTTTSRTGVPGASSSGVTSCGDDGVSERDRCGKAAGGLYDPRLTSPALTP